MDLLERVQSGLMNQRVSRRTVLLGAGVGVMSGLLAACGGDDDDGDDDGPTTGGDSTATTSTSETPASPTTATGTGSQPTMLPDQGEPVSGGSLKLGYIS